MDDDIKSFVKFVIKHPCITIAAFCFIAISLAFYDVMSGPKAVKLLLGMIGAGAIMDMTINRFLPMDSDDDDDAF